MVFFGSSYWKVTSDMMSMEKRREERLNCNVQSELGRCLIPGNLVMTGP